MEHITVDKNKRKTILAVVLLGAILLALNYFGLDENVKNTFFSVFRLNFNPYFGKRQTLL